MLAMVAFRCSKYKVGIVVVPVIPAQIRRILSYITRACLTKKEEKKKKLKENEFWENRFC